MAESRAHQPCAVQESAELTSGQGERAGSQVWGRAPLQEAGLGQAPDTGVRMPSYEGATLRRLVFDDEHAFVCIEP